MLLRREMAVFLPAIGLAGLWFGADAMILIAATALGVAWMGRNLPPLGQTAAGLDAATGLCLRPEAEAQIDRALATAREAGGKTAALVVGFDDEESVQADRSQTEVDHLLRRSAERLRGALRDRDILARLDGLRFAVILQPTPRLDLEGLIQISSRLQAAVETPLSVRQQTVTVTAHVGFCPMSRAPKMTGAALLSAAEAAADAARRSGPSAIRAYAPDIWPGRTHEDDLTREAAAALEEGRIIAHLQPQLCTDTGEVSGFDAVPRWLHAARGILTEAEILPAIESAGLIGRLQEVLVFNAFHALRDWDRQGAGVATISLPVHPQSFHDPKFASRMQWDFDRFEISPGRVRFVLSPAILPLLVDEVVRHNLDALGEMGAGLDLSDFGMGATSVAQIRRSGAQRLRLHRTFVARIDTDPAQQRAAAALIAMADGLGLETLADGVGSIGEHAMLAQLGCRHVQGAGIARAMPQEETAAWLERHRAKISQPPRLGRGRGTGG